MVFERSIDNNENIKKDFKQIAKESFSSIYEFLGKNNFKRWIHTREISEDVKTLIIDWMEEREEEENFNAAGLTYTFQNKITLKKPKSEAAEKRKGHVLKHEIYHQITRHSSSFCTYINEGLTEYLTGMTVEEGSDSYLENVRMVEFLHEMLGNSFIKAYLLRKR